MSKRDHVNSNCCCNYSPGVELESAASRSFRLLSCRKRRCVLFVPKHLYVYFQAFPTEDRNVVDEFSAISGRHVILISITEGTIGLMSGYVISPFIVLGKTVPHRPKGQSCLPYEINWVWWHHWDMRSGNILPLQVGLPDSANKNTGCCLNSNFRAPTNSIWVYVPNIAFY